MFSQITKRTVATPRLLLGATLVASAWVAVCASCFVDLGSLPSALKAPLSAPTPALPCACPSQEPAPALRDADHASGNAREAVHAPLPCRT